LSQAFSSVSRDNKVVAVDGQVQLAVLGVKVESVLSTITIQALG